MSKSFYIHGNNLIKKISKTHHPKFLDEVYERYLHWKESSESLNSDSDTDLERKVALLNEYKNYVDLLSEKGNLKLQDKVASSIIEEFLFYVFKDMPQLKSVLEDGLIHAGQAHAYTDLSFVPKDFTDFQNRPGVYINKKNQDFAISKIVNCVFETNGVEEMAQIIVPAVAIECKTFIPSTMLGQSSYEAHRLKQGNPYALYIIVAEQNALSEDVNLKNLDIDEIFILRKQKRNSKKNKLEDKNPIDFFVVRDMYNFVKKHLEKPWFNVQKATEKGRLIQT